ncbi:MAG: electron transport complex subunit RsxE [Lachnospirales bacterium]
MNKFTETLTNGIWKENPILVQIIGMCPTLAVTTSAENALGMGLATTTVLVMSNLFISLLKNLIPDKVRIPAFIVIIASFVTIIQFILKAYFYELNESLGLFIPLIVVNCLILARAEAFASKHNPLLATLDGLGMGLGFTLGLLILGSVRELLGSGTVLGLSILPDFVPRTIAFVLPPGAFLSLGFILALIKHGQLKKEAR